MNTLTEHDRWNLADIAWFLKGWIHADEDCPFKEDHVETIKKIMENISETVKGVDE